MDYKSTAAQILEKIGGKENLISAAHCATRLRLVIADNNKCDSKAVENIDGVKGVFFASGQLQIIIGTGTVNKVYEEFVPIAGIEAASKDDVKKAAAAKQNIFKRAIKALGDVFVPIIPAIVASGLLMGLLEGLAKLFPDMASNGTYIVMHLFSNAAFVFLPVLIAISAARVFGGNMFLGAVIGMIMIHPDLLNAWSVATAETVPQASVWFGLYNINLVGYQGHVIPVIIAVWFMCFIEKRLHKIVPEIIDLFVTPLVTVLLTGYLTLTVFGPVFSTLETWLLTGVQYLIAIPFGIGAFLMGGLYAPTVVGGVHHMYNVIEAGMLSADGLNTWMPIASAANVAQGAAALAFAIRTKNKKLKSMALPASLSAFLGITEPAIFGVNMRFIKPFISGCIGGAVGALLASVMKIGATAYGVTGIFGFLITTDYTLQYAIVIVVASAIAFLCSWFSYKKIKFDDEPIETTAENSKSEEIKDLPSDIKCAPNTVYAPLSGKVIPMEEIPDETFASGILGKGVGIYSESGKVYAPFDGSVATITDTKHALGLNSTDGIELIVHVGINTVALNGKGFTLHVNNGDEFKAGQLLMEYDPKVILDAGYNLTIAVLVTNAFNYSDVVCEKIGEIFAGDLLMETVQETVAVQEKVNV